MSDYIDQARGLLSECGMRMTDILQGDVTPLAVLLAQQAQMREALTELVALRRLEADIQRWVRDESSGKQWPEMQPYARRMAAIEDLKRREVPAWEAAYAIADAAQHVEGAR